MLYSNYYFKECLIILKSVSYYFKECILLIFIKHPVNISKLMFKISPEIIANIRNRITQDLNPTNDM